MNFLAWVQISEGSETVDAMFKTTHGEWIRGGSVIAKNGCWSLLKGGMAAHLSGPVEIFFVVTCLLHLIYVNFSLNSIELCSNLV